MRAMIELPGRSSAGKLEDFDSQQIEAVVQWEDYRSCGMGKTLGQHRDPIFTPLFTQLGLTGVIGTIGTTAITTGMVAGAIATTSLTIGFMEICQ